MKKLTDKEGKELLILLKRLKNNGWIIDPFTNFLDILEIIEFHNKVSGLVSAYDNQLPMEQLSNMIKDLCDYFKKEIVEPKTKICKRCRKKKEIELFFNREICKECFKKK